MPKPMYVWTGTAWVSVASEVESLATYATQSYADAQPGMKMIVPASVSVGSGSATVSPQGTVSFTNASSIVLSNIFNSTYTDYEVIFKVTSVSVDDLDVYLRLRSGSTDATTNYKYERQYNLSSTTGADRDVLGTTVFPLMPDADSALPNYNSVVFKLFRPFEASPTAYHMDSIAEFSGSGLLHNNIMGVNTNATSYDSMNIYTSTGNISGNLRIYGYKNG